MTTAVELRMPLGYVEMDAEEMEYLSGGDARNFKNNLLGLWNKSETLRWALRSAGIGLGTIYNYAYVSYWYVCANVAWKLGVSLSLVSRVVGFVACLGAVAAATYVWNKRIWY